MDFTGSIMYLFGNHMVSAASSHRMLQTGALLFFLLVAGIASLAVSCRTTPKSPVVAKVGSSVLTLDDLYKSIPPEYSDFITREQIVNYVKQWIDNKILYHEALRLKVDREDAIVERLKKMKEDLLCAEMISRNAVPTQDVRIPEEMIKSYFAENKNKFVREKNVARYLQIVADDIATAWKVRSQVTPDNFLFLASQYSKVPPPDIRNAPYVKLDDIPPEIAQEISGTRINGTTNVIKTAMGFCIIRVLDKQPKGTLCQLSEVRDDIVNILTSKMQNAALERLISQLRSKMIVEAHLEVIADQHKAPADTAEQEHDAPATDSARRGGEE
jgi:hypothetical protein